MTDVILTGGYNDGDIDTNRSTGPSLNDLIATRYSRRETFRSGAVAMATAAFGGSLLVSCDSNDNTSSNNPAPTVTATASPTTITVGNKVTITATATDNTSVSGSSFVQVSGPTVTLSATSGTTTSFLAPAVTAASTVVIRFTATDSAGVSSSIDANVTVNPSALSFTAVAKNKLDVVTVPTGYTVSILYRTGDPINAATPAYKADGTDTNFGARIGDHGDALYWFGVNAAGARDVSSSTRGVIVQNFENINQQYLHIGAPSPAPRPESEVIKEIEAHGVGVTEVAQTAATGAWAYVQSSTFNRRITPLTPVVFNGPVKGASYLVTAFSSDGTQGRGTLNNCANGYTPWGTAITCEENWAGYFRRPPATDNLARTNKEITALTRYGVTSTTGNFLWSTVVPADASNTAYSRFNSVVSGAAASTDFRNEHNQFGWVVEIDPYDATKTPRKRTALGRMNHEGCWPSNFVAGVKPAFYMGDDAVNEYLYKFVSATAWASADAAATDRLSIGDKYLDNGTLYVAQFAADGSGKWLPLTFGTAPLTAANATYAFADQVDVLTHARLAGDALAATKMDRPEWTAVNPVTGEVYLTLTNNSTRTNTNTDAANPRAYQDPPSPAFGNRNGHIIRLAETGATSEATTFTWDIYLFGAGADLDPANINISGLTADNDFSSPDGLVFGRPSNQAGLGTPLLWIQTDDNAYTDVTNCMMLAAIPGTVADAGTTAIAKTITNLGTGGTSTTQATRVGVAPGAKLKRFLVGPVEAEITGIDTTPDGRTMFVGIQHPGENGNLAAITSHWPDSQTGTPAATVRPRSATIVIQRTDGGVIGL